MQYEGYDSYIDNDGYVVDYCTSCSARCSMKAMKAMVAMMAMMAMLWNNVMMIYTNVSQAVHCSVLCSMKAMMEMMVMLHTIYIGQCYIQYE